MSDSLPAVGRKTFRVRADSPRPVSAAKARLDLDVPSLSGDNVFTGTQDFGGEVTLRANLEQTAGESILGNTTTGVLDAAAGVIRAGQGVQFRYVAKTADYTLTVLDSVVDVTSGSPTITLLDAATVVSDAGGAAGRLYVVKNSGAGTVTLATTGGQTIDGAAPGTVAAGGVVRLVSTGTNWITV